MENWQSLTVDEVFDELSITKRGLTNDEAKQRSNKFGSNSLPHEKTFSSLRIFVEQLRSPLIYILIIAGIITFFLKDFTDCVVIFLTVLVNSLVGFVQENKVSNALVGLKKALTNKAVVLRNGGKKEILQEEIVPGDIIFLKAGDKVPADARLIESKNLKVNEASLTGEWLAVDKSITEISIETPLADRKNMVYMGTLIESGSASAIVVEIGLKTEIGKIAEMIKETKEEETPYQKKLINFGKVTAVIFVLLSLIIFILGILKGENFIDIFTASVAIGVASIPEGLPIAMTVVLALGMQKILRKKGLVRRLASAESLGSTTVICVDKTGTLTEGKMKVTKIVTKDREFERENLITLENTNDTIEVILKTVSLCSEAYVENPAESIEKQIIRGRPTDRALTEIAISAGIRQENIEKDEPQLDRLEFSPINKFSASLNRAGVSNRLYVMGAPEKILAMCSEVEVDSKTKKDLTLEINEELRQKTQNLMAKSFRVIAIATGETKENTISLENNLFSNLTFFGFVALEDPLRDEVKQAISVARGAGLKPIIVTGDHKLTAKAIASELGFRTADNNIIEGEELSRLSGEEFKNRLSEIEIYARLEPGQKLKIIEAWQSKGELVAMTGDGINDAPALKKADIGLALGSGSQVSHEVADIILLDDNFSVIVSAIEEGRAIIDNIRRSIVYLIADAFSELFIITVSVFLGWPLPVIAAQILWINLIEDGLPTIALAFEPKEADVMERKPNPKNLPLLNRPMVFFMIFVTLSTGVILMVFYNLLLRYSNLGIEHIRTVIFALMTMTTLFYIFSCKSLKKNIWQVNIFSNVWLILSWMTGVVFLLAAIYLPFLQKFLKTQALGINEWVFILGLSLLVTFLIEIFKHFLIKRKI